MRPRWRWALPSRRYPLPQLYETFGIVRLTRLGGTSMQNTTRHALTAGMEYQTAPPASVSLWLKGAERGEGGIWNPLVEAVG
jgi:hypothetical protein